MGAVKEYASCVCEKLANVIADCGIVPNYSFYTDAPDNPYEDWGTYDEAREWWYEELFAALVENGWDFYDIVTDHLNMARHCCGFEETECDVNLVERAVSHIAGFTERDDEVMGKFNKWIGWEAA